MRLPAGSVVALGESKDRVPSWFFRFGASQFRSPHFQALADLTDRVKTDLAHLNVDAETRTPFAQQVD